MNELLIEVHDYPDVDAAIIYYSDEQEAEWLKYHTLIREDNGIKEIQLNREASYELFSKVKSTEDISPGARYFFNDITYKRHRGVGGNAQAIIIVDKQEVRAMMPYKLHSYATEFIPVTLFAYVTPKPVFTRQGVPLVE